MSIIVTKHSRYLNLLLSFSLSLLIASLLVQATLAVGPYYVLPPGEAVKCVSVACPKHSVLFVDYEIYEFQANEPLHVTMELVRDENHPDAKVPPGSITRHAVKESKGKAVYKMPATSDKSSSRINVCLSRETEKKTFAHHSSRSAHYFSFRMKETPDFPNPMMNLAGLNLPKTNLFKGSKGTAKDKKGDSNESENQDLAREHLTYLERIILNMIKEAELLGEITDDIKVEESRFYHKSMEMNSAAKWWPILHVVVLILTGYTQVNHIVRFFKSRHII